MAARPGTLSPRALEATRPTARRRAAGLLAALLTSLVLLSACGPATSERTDTADGASAPTSQAPVESPTEDAGIADESSAAEANTAGPTTPEANTPGPTAPEPTSPETPVADEAAATSTAPAPTETPDAQPSAEPAAPAAASGTALAMLATLPEKGRGPKTGYDRDSFGWRDDMDRNGCDTRNDILRRDLHAITLKEGTQGCVVLRGTLISPYSGDTIAFDRTDSTIDIDHVVALSDAWQTGASSWDEGTKREFANDPLNLLVVESSLNRQKGAGDAATWLPPKKDYRCEYVSRQIAVKAKYELWVKPAEAEAMERVLSDCEGFLALTGAYDWPGTGGGDVVGTEAQPAAEPAPAPAPAPKPAPAKDSAPAPAKDDGGSVHFKNCGAARAAGAAPVRTGDPGYAKHLDGDGDGVGCE